jgi:hypothetical protein
MMSHRLSTNEEQDAHSAELAQPVLARPVRGGVTRGDEHDRHTPRRPSRRRDRDVASRACGERGDDAPEQLDEPRPKDGLAGPLRVLPSETLSHQSAGQRVVCAAPPSFHILP